MKCSDIREQASIAPLELSPAMQGHLMHCEQCSLFVDSLLVAQRALAAIGPTEIPAGLGQRLARQALSQPSLNNGYLEQLVRIARPFAAAAVVVAIMVFLVFKTAPESTEEEQDTVPFQGELASVQDEFLQSSYALVGGE